MCQRIWLISSVEAIEVIFFSSYDDDEIIWDDEIEDEGIAGENTGVGDSLLDMHVDETLSENDNLFDREDELLS